MKIIMNKKMCFLFNRALGRAWDGLAWTREACTEIRNLGVFERKQAKVCRATLDVMPSLVQAAKDTSIVCQQAFRNRRWNCSSIDRAPDYTPELLTGTIFYLTNIKLFFPNNNWMGKELKLMVEINKNWMIWSTGTREQAFVYAMSAAAAIWRLARGCALGSLASCSCATPPRREPPSPSALISSSSYSPTSMSFALSPKNSFKWGGCGDDVRSASRLAKRFLQGTSPSSSLGTGKFMYAVNMHNNRAGRRVSLKNLWCCPLFKITI